MPWRLALEFCSSTGGDFELTIRPMPFADSIEPQLDN
jgi:hypothetical protein